MANIKKLSKGAKRLAVFLDGTWNEPGSNTNVWRLRSLCSPVASNGTVQLHYYDPGPSGFRGGTFGEGVSKNVVQAYEWLIDHYNEGDDIFIFGFSRGAFTVLKTVAPSFSYLFDWMLPSKMSWLPTFVFVRRLHRASEKTLWKLMEKMGLLN